MTHIDTTAILRDIYGARAGPSTPTWSERPSGTGWRTTLSGPDGRETGDCDVYPSSPGLGPLWPFLAATLGARRFLEVGCGLGYTAALMDEAAGPDGHVGHHRGASKSMPTWPRPRWSDDTREILAKHGVYRRRIDPLATVEQRVTALETEFRTELKHLATKADLVELEHRLTLRLGGLMILVGGLVGGILRLWQ